MKYKIGDKVLIAHNYSDHRFKDRKFEAIKCGCCNGDEAVYYKDNENNMFIDSKGEVLVTVKGNILQFNVKHCPNCGKEF